MTQSAQVTSATTFTFHNITISAFERDGLLWLEANQVCKALEYANPRTALANHVDERDVLKQDTPTESGIQTKNFVNESGLYALIFGSKKESAKTFKRWVTSEVLPTIRKTGKYESVPRLSTVADRVPLKDAVNLLVARAGISYSDAYRMVHQRFAVDSVEELTLEQLPQAVEYVHKLVLSGELLPREETPQEDIRSHQVAAIALMHTGWRRFEEQKKALLRLRDLTAQAHERLKVTLAETRATLDLTNDILYGSGAIWDGLHEALFHLHLPVDVMKEGRQRAETNYTPRILA